MSHSMRNALGVAIVAAASLVSASAFAAGDMSGSTAKSSDKATGNSMSRSDSKSKTDSKTDWSAKGKNAAAQQSPKSSDGTEGPSASDQMANMPGSQRVQPSTPAKTTK